jgi:plasmid maintenance system antidote protein VapI
MGGKATIMTITINLERAFGAKKEDWTEMQRRVAAHIEATDTVIQNLNQEIAELESAIVVHFVRNHQE